MKLIGSFFEKFRSKALREVQKRVIISEILKKEANLDIPIENISFNNEKLKIKASSIEKNQIFIKKQAIISAISKRISEKIITIE